MIFEDYFARLCAQAQEQAVSLPAITLAEAKAIWDVTLGVPLAVQIAAGIYVKTADLHTITQATEGSQQRELVDKMVRRYLLHVGDDLAERARLYGLALLRRADQPVAVATALGLTPGQAATGDYTRELTRLHRHYSFIFTEKAQPALHQEVRHFLRLALLEGERNKPEIKAVIERLKATHEAALVQIEQTRQYRSLKERVQDEEWVGVYLDLTEQQFWHSAADGVRYALPLMIATAIYWREAAQEVAQIGKLFEGQLKNPYSEWWEWAGYLVFPRFEELSNRVFETYRGLWLGLWDSIWSFQERGSARLTTLAKVVNQQHLGFPRPLSIGREELEAILWWRLGEACQGQDDVKALEWFERALDRLGDEAELKATAAETANSVAYELSRVGKFAEMLPLMNRAIGFDPHNITAYIFRGTAYAALQEYQRAIDDFTQVLTLDPTNALAYYNRGNAYADLWEYHHAIEDYTKGLVLAPNDADAYHNRGRSYANLKDYHYAIEDYIKSLALNPDDCIAYCNRASAYLWLKDTRHAQADYQKACELDPTQIGAAWMVEWTTIGTEIVGSEVAERLKQIAAIDPANYIAFICRGVALGISNQLKAGLAELEQALKLQPNGWSACFWKGMLCAYFYQERPTEAKLWIEKALEQDMPPVLLTPLYWLEKDRPAAFAKLKGYLEQYLRDDPML